MNLQNSIVVTTYNQPNWLKKVLLGFSVQDTGDFELVIADDGSTAETAEVIRWAREHTSLTVHHVWQADDGFRKCRILNKAILAAAGDYLIFTDGDCIPRSDFVTHHISHRSAGCFLSGGYVKLPLDVSLAIGDEDILNGEFANRRWLRAQGLGRFENIAKLTSRGRWADFLNRTSRTRAGWHGHNASCWKSDALQIQGFDERMGWGGEDREFGYRLLNAGVKPVRIRYSAICLHLYHDRPWRDKEVLAANDRIREHTRQSGVSTTQFGTNLLDSELGNAA